MWNKVSCLKIRVGVRLEEVCKHYASSGAPAIARAAVSTCACRRALVRAWEHRQERSHECVGGFGHAKEGRGREFARGC